MTFYFHLDPSSPRVSVLSPLTLFAFEIGEKDLSLSVPIEHTSLLTSRLKEKASETGRVWEKQEMLNTWMKRICFSIQWSSPFSLPLACSLSLLPQTRSLFPLECPAPRKCTANLCGMLMNSKGRGGVDVSSPLANSSSADRPCKECPCHSWALWFSKNLSLRQGMWGVVYASIGDWHVSLSAWEKKRLDVLLSVLPLRLLTEVCWCKIFPQDPVCLHVCFILATSLTFS